MYPAFSADETVLGFAYPREERVALVAAEPATLRMPAPSDERFNRVQVRLAAVDRAEPAELVVDAWRRVVPRRVAAAHDAGETPYRP